MPAIVSGKVQKFLFKEEDVVNVFDLNNLYAECKKDKKYQAQIKQQLESQEEEEERQRQGETKKDK